MKRAGLAFLLVMLLWPHIIKAEELLLRCRRYSVYDCSKEDLQETINDLYEDRQKLLDKIEANKSDRKFLEYNLEKAQTGWDSCRAELVDTLVKLNKCE